jgi:NAD(P)-dependent dehydrogenase (short-subunit alcohol dehydrogenase family)
MGDTALIVGAGNGLSAALARAFAAEGFACVLAARDAAKLEPLCRELGATAVACDAADPGAVAALFARLDRSGAALEVAVYNAGYRVRGPIVELDPREVARTLAVTAYGGFLVAQAAARRMLARGRGTLFFTGASASVKGYPQSAPFAMGKFALRGLAQSLARELQPRNIHVAHVVIDGGIRSAQRRDPPDNPDSLLDPDAIAQSYVHLWKQPRTAWAWEIALRPWVERF